MNAAKFSIGQIVQHKLFDYRGLIVDVDHKFLGSDEWYEQVARSCPPKDQPWYHVIVDNARHMTYVAERNLELTDDVAPIHHPLLSEYFNGMDNGQYQQKAKIN